MPLPCVNAKPREGHVACAILSGFPGVVAIGALAVLLRKKAEEPPSLPWAGAPSGAFPLLQAGGASRVSYLLLWNKSPQTWGLHDGTYHPPASTARSGPHIQGAAVKASAGGHFPGGPVVKSARSQCRGPSFDPWSGD